MHRAWTAQLLMEPSSVGIGEAGQLKPLGKQLMGTEHWVKRKPKLKISIRSFPLELREMLKKMGEVGKEL